MLAGIIAIVIIMAVGATLLTKGTVALMGKYGGESIHRLHSNAEHIVNTHTMPDGWRKDLEKRFAGLRDDRGTDEQREAHRRKAMRIAISRLDKLIAHFKRTSLVEDEEARAILLNELSAAREEWSSGGWDDMIR